MPSNSRYYSLEQNGSTAELNIYGDITPWAWEEFGEVSAYGLSKQLEQLSGVDTINVNIKSFGGDVNEGLAIHNALKRHSAKIVTRCDGFACSIASVIFMAGDERIMYDTSLLMIHNAWTTVRGANAAQLRKVAEDMDTITQASKNAYMARVNITEEKLTEMMDAETWISPQDALDMGFATSIDTFDESSDQPRQSGRNAFFSLFKSAMEKFKATAGMTAQASEPATDHAPEPAAADPAPATDPEPPAEPAEGGEDPAPDGAEDNSGNEEEAAKAAFLMQLSEFLGGK